jgi:hypothetical protein
MTLLKALMPTWCSPGNSAHVYGSRAGGGAVDSIRSEHSRPFTRLPMLIFVVSLHASERCYGRPCA